MLGPHAVLDDRRPGAEAPRFPALLQQTPDACRADRAHARLRPGSRPRERQFVPLAGALSWAISDTDRGVTCGRRRLALPLLATLSRRATSPIASATAATRPKPASNRASRLGSSLRRASTTNHDSRIESAAAAGYVGCQPWSTFNEHPWSVFSERQPRDHRHLEPSPSQGSGHSSLIDRTNRSPYAFVFGA